MTITDLVTPGETDAAIDARSAGAAWDNPHPWIVDGVDLAGHYSSVDETALNAFRHATTSGLTVTIDAGEAYVSGWLVRDRTTDVTLPDDQTTRVYVGYDAGAILSTDQAPTESENVIIGTEVAFDDGDPKTPIYDFTASGGEITDTYDHRQKRKPVEFDPIGNQVRINDAGLDVDGQDVATENYVDSNRYQDDEARAAVVDVELPGSQIHLPNVDGHPDGVLVGPSGDIGLSALGGDTVLYNMVSGGAFRMRNYTSGPGDLLRVDSHTGDGWIRGGWEVDGGLIDGREGAGLVPKVLSSGESLPSGTVPGRIVYDPSREQ